MIRKPFFDEAAPASVHYPNQKLFLDRKFQHLKNALNPSYITIGILIVLHITLGIIHFQNTHGTTPDSFRYAESAKNLALTGKPLLKKFRLLNTPDIQKQINTPQKPRLLSEHPYFYPIITAIFIKVTGFKPVQSARLVSLLSFALLPFILFLFSREIFKGSKADSWQTLALIQACLISSYHYYISYALSETLSLLLLGLLFTLFLRNYLKNHLTQKDLFLSHALIALVAFFAIQTRIANIFFVFGLGLYVLMDTLKNKKFKENALLMILLAAGALTSLYPMKYMNTDLQYYSSGPLVSMSYNIKTFLSENLYGLLFAKITEVKIVKYVAMMASAGLITLILTKCRQVIFRSKSLIILFAIFSFWVGMFIITSTKAVPGIGERYMMQAFPWLIILLYSFVGTIENKRTQLFILFFLFLGPIFHGLKTYTIYKNLKNNPFPKSLQTFDNEIIQKGDIILTSTPEAQHYLKNLSFYLPTQTWHPIPTLTRENTQTLLKNYKRVWIIIRKDLYKEMGPFINDLKKKELWYKGKDFSNYDVYLLENT